MDISLTPPICFGSDRDRTEYNLDIPYAHYLEILVGTSYISSIKVIRFEPPKVLNATGLLAERRAFTEAAKADGMVVNFFALPRQEGESFIYETSYLAMSPEDWEKLIQEDEKYRRTQWAIQENKYGGKPQGLLPYFLAAHNGSFEKFTIPNQVFRAFSAEEIANKPGFLVRDFELPPVSYDILPPVQGAPARFVKYIEPLPANDVIGNPALMLDRRGYINIGPMLQQELGLGPSQAYVTPYAAYTLEQELSQWKETVRDRCETFQMPSGAKLQGQELEDCIQLR